LSNAKSGVQKWEKKRRKTGAKKRANHIQCAQKEQVRRKRGKERRNTRGAAPRPGGNKEEEKKGGQNGGIQKVPDKGNPNTPKWDQKNQHKGANPQQGMEKLVIAGGR